jgi:glycosyltransferase involved in cell wall biosynthesis
MKTIAIDAREYTTGTGRYMFRLLQYLETIDTQHQYLILLQPKDMDVYDFKNPNFKKVACPHKEFTFDEQIGFKRQLDQLKPDLVHFGMVQQPVWYRGTVVTTMQDLTTLRFDNPAKNPLIFRAKQQVYKWVNKRAAKKSAAIITISEFVKQDIINFTGVNPDKITVTYEAADPITDAPEPVAALQDKQFIMYVGRPLPHKNLWRLIEAFQQLQVQHPKLVLALAGKKDSLYQAIEDLVKSQGIKNVVFTDFVSEGQLRWMYEQCAAYTFPSLSEGFGLPALEAMAHGAPVVSSNATCSPEIYGDAAHYFDPLNVQSMADAINEVLTDADLRKQLIAAGQVQVKKYSWKRMAEQTLSVYDAVLHS